MNTHTRYRVCVDNHHAQIKLSDHTRAYHSREGAVEEIVTCNYNSIDDDLMAEADKVADFENDNPRWHLEYNRLWTEKRVEIAERGYEDGDGHRFYVCEEDDRSPFYVAIIRKFYGPKDELSFMKDEYGLLREYKTVSWANEIISEVMKQPYSLANGESGRPDMLIIGQSAMDWIENDDGGKYDWDGCACERGEDGECCGECDDCFKWMRDRDIEYIYENAITE